MDAEIQYELNTISMLNKNKLTYSKLLVDFFGEVEIQSDLGSTNLFLSKKMVLKIICY